MSEAIKPKFWVDVHMNVMSAGGMVAFPCISAGPDKQQENAGLIADAFSARDTTGLTPSQLVEQRDALVERVKELEEALAGVVERFGPTVDELIFSKRMAINKARAVLSRALPNTVAEVKE